MTAASLLEVPWQRGRGYDLDALTSVYTSDQAWARLVIRKTAEQVEVATMRALGFCVSVAHARFMAAQFAAAGIPAVAVWGDSPEEERRRALADLRAGAVRVVFSVDLFNEGVDIPEIDTLLMLRPTESATLFLQQLGRGLRKTATKDVCTVLDFISQHRREFRFDLKMRALIGGGSRKDLERNIADGFPNLPPGTSASMDSVAQEIVLASIRNALPTRMPQYVSELRALVAAGHEPTLANFLEHTGVELQALYSSNRCFADLLDAAGLPTRAAGPKESALRRAIGRLLHIDDAQRTTLYRCVLAGAEPDVLGFSERDRRLWRMLIAQLMDTAAKVPISLSEATTLLWKHSEVRSELGALMGVLEDRIDHEHLPVAGAPDWPFLVHAGYSRIEVQAGLGDGGLAKVPDWREGVRWFDDEQTDAFLVTLDKSEGGFSPTTAYRDYAMSRTLFHWESQSTTSAESPVGQRYIHHELRGSRVLLFARNSKSDREFWFLAGVS